MIDGLSVLELQSVRNWWSEYRLRLSGGKTLRILGGKRLFFHGAYAAKDALLHFQLHTQVYLFFLTESQCEWVSFTYLLIYQGLN